MAIVAFACTQDSIVENPNVGQDPNNGNIHNGDVVTFGFNFEDYWTPDVIGPGQPESYNAQTPAAKSARSEAVLMECDKDGAIDNVYMYMVEENIPAIAKYGDATRAEGDSNNGEGVTTNNGYGNIGIIAFHTFTSGENNTTTVFMDNINLNEYQDNTYWPAKGGNIDFYAYAPHYDSQTAPTYYSVTKDGYSAPKISYQVPTDITKQLDLMDGYVQTNDYVDGKVDISMSHLLSQIQVKLGSIDQGRITKIEINGVYSKGLHTINNKDDKSVTIWNIDDSVKDNYVQTNASGLENNANGVVGGSMYLMPQTLPSEATIVITVQVPTENDTKDAQGNNNYSDVKTYSLCKKISEITDVWKPNKSYTYIISTPNEIQVEVTDVVEQVEGGAPQKKDLVITNAGMATAYIRLDMVGAWCVDKENIINGETKTETLVVGDWKPAEDGIFVWGEGGEPRSADASVRNWRKGADGYYYYMLPLRRGEQIKGANAFFESYTLTNRGPMNNAYLELTIMVQAVLTDDAEMLWDSAIWNVLKNNQ